MANVTFLKKKKNTTMHNEKQNESKDHTTQERAKLRTNEQSAGKSLIDNTKFNEYHALISATNDPDNCSTHRNRGDKNQSMHWKQQSTYGPHTIVHNLPTTTLNATINSNDIFYRSGRYSPDNKIQKDVIPSSKRNGIYGIRSTKTSHMEHESQRNLTILKLTLILCPLMVALIL